MSVKAQRGMLSPLYILLTLFTGISFCLLGIVFAYPNIHIDRLILTLAGVTILQGVVTHAIHDYYMYEDPGRKTLKKKHLKIAIVSGITASLLILFYLSLTVHWSLILLLPCGIFCFYARNLLYHPLIVPISFGLLPVASFYIQTLTITPSSISLSAAVFTLVQGGINLYRFDDKKPSDLKSYIHNNLSIMFTSFPIFTMAILLRLMGL